MVREGPAARRGGFDPCLRLAALEQLFNRDVSGLFQGIEVCAQVAVGGFQDGFQAGERQRSLRAKPA